MAVKRETVPAVVPVDQDAALLATLFDAGETYTSDIREGNLAALWVAIDAEITAHAIFAPAYATAEKEWLAVNVGKKYTANKFTSMVTASIKVSRNDPTLKFGISDQALSNIVAFSGDRAFHEDMVELFMLQVLEQEWNVAMPAYRRYLRRFADGHFNRDGITPDGMAANQADATLDDSANAARVCGTDFALNIRGVGRVAALAWLEAAIDDLKVLKAQTAKGMSLKDKATAHKLVKNARDTETTVSVVPVADAVTVA